MNGLIDALLHPLEWSVAWSVFHFHNVLVALGLPEGAGITWSLSLAGIVLAVHIVLFPSLIWRLRKKHRLRGVGPDIAALRGRYAEDPTPEERREMIREMTEVHRQHGSNPLYFVGPLLVQLLVFIALVRAVRQSLMTGLGPLTATLAEQAGGSTVLGVKLVDNLLQTGGGQERAFFAVVILATATVSLLSRRRQARRNTPPHVPEAARSFIRLLAWAIFGLTVLFWPRFPFGLLVVMVANSFWGGVKRAGVTRWSPQPGSLADQALQERKARRAGTLPGAPSPRPAAGPTDETRGEARDSP